MLYKEIYPIAIGILKRLSPWCTDAIIAGSVSREKEDCKDIEIVCLPRTTTHKDMFGETTGEQRLRQFCDVVKSLGLIIKGNTDGRYMQIMLPDGIALDLFMPLKDNYIRTVVIRTGPSEYSHNVIAAAWKKKGWCGTEDGLRLVSECINKSKEGVKAIWKCDVEYPTYPPVFETELDFFSWLGVPYQEPNKRKG